MKNQIKSKLFELADQKYKEFHSSLCPGTENIIGVRVPILRNYAKELSKEYEISQLLQEIDNQYYEEIMLQGMIIGLAKQEFNNFQEQIKQFVPKIDNWAVCDVFCAGLKQTKKYKKEMWTFLQKYLKSDKEFEIRFGVVMTLDYYIEEEYLEKIFCIFDDITSTQYYVQMAVAWAISIALIKFYNQTIKYLENAKLDKFTFNKALQKAIESYRITEEQKQEAQANGHTVQTFQKKLDYPKSSGLTVTGDTPEAEDIRTSVGNYGGFYIAKYEAGIPGTTQSVTEDHKTSTTGNILPVSQPNVGVWNWISRTDAITVSKKMIDYNEIGVHSTLISGTAWDTTLQWITNTVDSTYATNSANKGNYSGSIAVTSSNLTTAYSKNNIYDMAGNVYEWTTENCTISGGSFLVGRGRSLRS